MGFLSAYRSRRQAAASAAVPADQRAPATCGPLTASLLALEPRVMLDGAALVTAAAVAADTDSPTPEAPEAPADGVDNDAPQGVANLVDGPAGGPATDQAGTALVIIDPAIRDLDGFLAGLEQGVDVVVLDPDRDGVTQIAEILAARDGVSALHIVSDGADGILKLGNGLLSAHTLDSYADAFAGWDANLADGADIYLWGCNVAATAGGEAFVNRIASLTGADVAASSNITGVGGDWTLEYRAGDVATAAPLSLAGQNTYDGRLAMFVVMNGADSGTGSLRQAILDANGAAGADIITFDPALSGTTINVAAGQMVITDALTIMGDIDNDGTADITLDAADSSRFFEINTPSAVVMEGLTLQNGQTNGAVGGAVLVRQGSLTFRDGQGLNNATMAVGPDEFDGGVFFVAQGATLIVENSHFSGNDASRAGGVIYGNRSNITVSDSTFDMNRALSATVEGRGGAIAGELATIMVDGSTFTNNSAHYGGALHLRNLADGGQTSTMTVTNSIVRSNTAEVAGGGIRVRDNTGLILDNVIVDQNTLNAVTSAGFSEQRGGGGISIATTGAVRIDNSEITNNRILDTPILHWGGGVQILGSNDVEINDTQISGNVAASNGGGLGMSSGTATLTNVTFDGNRVEGNNGTQVGGNIALRRQFGSDEASLTLVNSDVLNGVAEFGGGISILGSSGDNATVDMTGGEIAGNTAVRGGGVNNFGGTLTMDNVSVHDNSATGDGDAGRGGGINVANNGKATVTNSAIWNNTAEFGGGVYVGNPGNSSEFVGVNITISGNSSRDSGAGMRVFSGSATLLFATIAFNQAETDGSGTGAGGLAVRNGASLDLGLSIVSGNTTNGGAIANDDGNITDLGSNFIGFEGNGPGTVDLQPLMVNSQGTPTHALGADSVAINAADANDYPGGFSVQFPAADQRGLPFVRIFGGAPDAGAFEVSLVKPEITGGTATTYVEPDGPQGDGATVLAGLGLAINDVDSTSFKNVTINLTDAQAGDALLMTAADLAANNLQFTSENGMGVPGAMLTVTSTNPGDLTQAQANAIFDLVRFRTNDAVPDNTPDRHLSMTVTDSTDQVSDPFEVTIDVTGTNDTPSWAQPGVTPAVTVDENASLVLSDQLAPGDLTPFDLDDDTDWPEPGATPTLIVLTVDHGTLDINVGATGASVVAGAVTVGGVVFNSANGSNVVVIQGSSNDPGALNNLLDGNNGGSVTYTPDAGYDGPDTLTMVQDDQQDYNVVPAKFASKMVAITVNDVPDNPDNPNNGLPSDADTGGDPLRTELRREDYGFKDVDVDIVKGDIIQDNVVLPVEAVVAKLDALVKQYGASFDGTGSFGGRALFEACPADDPDAKNDPADKALRESCEPRRDGVPGDTQPEKKAAPDGDKPTPRVPNGGGGDGAALTAPPGLSAQLLGVRDKPDQDMAALLAAFDTSTFDLPPVAKEAAAR